MEIGIDSFATLKSDNNSNKPYPELAYKSLNELLAKIQLADQVELDVFGIGEHYRQEFLDSAPSIILAAASKITKKIRLTSAVTVLSAIDPVRIFQSFSTLDLISRGRAEMVVGRGSFTEAFPLFGLDLNDYDKIFLEKLKLLLKIRKNKIVNWLGNYRPPLNKQAIYPRPFQEHLPIWLGVGGTPQSFIRAGEMGLPLMVAVIGGQTHRFRPLIDLYRQTGLATGHAPEKLKVGLHSLGFVADDKQKAADDFYQGYKKTFNQLGKERGWPSITQAKFKKEIGPLGALVIGDAQTVAEKIIRHSHGLGGISRFTFQMDNANLPNQKLLKSIEIIGQQVKPYIKKHLKS